MTNYYPRWAIIGAGALCGFLLGNTLSGHAASAAEKAPAVSSAGALGKLALGGPPIALLGGRLSVKMSPAAQAHPRAHDIMAAPAADTDESRVVLDAGKERLVLMASELYALSGGNLESAARAEVAGAWGKEAAAVKLEKLAVTPPLTAVALVPPRQDGKLDANLVLGLFVGSGDGTVQYLAFYANPAGARDAAGVAALCRKIAATVRAGGRRLSWKPGPRSFPGIGSDRLVITAPEGFVASAQRGPDFSVYVIRKLSPLGQPSSACGIYLGSHPDYQYRQTDTPPGKVTPLKGDLLGKEVEWQTWSVADQTTSEAIVPYPKADGVALHVFCSAGSPAEVTALRAVAETLRVEEPKR